MHKIQTYILAAITFLIPLIALFAPLAMVPVFIICAIYPTYIFIKNGGLKNFWKGAKINQILIVILAYAAISCLWAIEPKQSINLWSRMLLIFLGYIALFAYVPDDKISRTKILNFLIYGLLIGCLIANIEIFSNGFISETFGYVSKYTGKFDLAFLNRGASVMSIMAWPVVGFLCAQKKYKTAFGLVLAIFFTIIRLDSLSAVLGLVIGGVVFILVYFGGGRVLKTLAIFAACAVFVVAFAAKNMDAHKLVGHVPVVPGGASDIRLFIWDYAAKQADKKPIFGWGFNASRSYPVKESDYVQGGRSPLPLHPHNNVLQVWLELGVIGLCLFAAFLFISLWSISAIAAPPYVMAALGALFVDYFAVGEIGYGIWQNWWVCAGILAAFFVKIATSEIGAENDR